MKKRVLRVSFLLIVAMFVVGMVHQTVVAFADASPENGRAGAAAVGVRNRRGARAGAG